MEQVQQPSLAVSRELKPSRGRGYLCLGLLFGALGLFGYAIQLVVFQLVVVPWYAPIAGTVGVLLVIVSLRQRFTIPRTLVALLLALGAGVEWLFLFSFTVAPAYAGPVRVGAKLPTFSASFADGRSISEKDLEQGKNTVMVFFRGRW